ncbi:MAG TPA: hypothetical protein VE685_02820, partial [Thermoanaerobaculia bacterium]|nr:hypothetical protein [Thermoanaerobaculia bacterium]
MRSLLFFSAAADDLRKREGDARTFVDQNVSLSGRGREKACVSSVKLLSSTCFQWPLPGWSGRLAARVGKREGRRVDRSGSRAPPLQGG